MSAHTPGPWTAPETSVWAGEEQVATCDWVLECSGCGLTEPNYKAGRGAFNPREVRTANARLIAAAPDLRAVLDHPALLELLGAIEDSGSPEAARFFALAQAWDVARQAAIDKAGVLQ